MDVAQCPRCGASNAPTQRFCGSCGEALHVRCSSCGSDNPPAHQFCGACGASLKVVAPPRSAALPEERRWTTILFADLSGFTRMSERMDPEDVRTLVDRSMTMMGEIVVRYGGFVERVIGDELLALFGAPVAHEDDPERAVRAALDLQRCAAERVAEFGGLPLRIGVNTGEVMFAPVGPEGARHLTVMGDVANTASRLQTAAPPGGILVGEDTYRATLHTVRYEPVEPFKAKGKEAPVRAWRPLEAAARPSVRPLSAVPMVGRDTELEVLWRTWERVVSEGRPHLVTVLGAPGIGKTRLARELVTLVEAKGARCLSGRSLPYGERTGYGAFAEQVKGFAGIFETDPAPEARTKLAAACQVLPDNEADQVASHLAVLLGLGAEEAGPEKAHLLYSARRFVEAVGQDAPVIFLFEDVHWSDPSLLELIESLAGRVRQTSALLLTLARPELLEIRPTWAGGLPAYTALPLDPLPVEGAEALATGIAPHLGRGLAARLAEVAGGNPLFIEELAATISDGTAELLAHLPTNVKATIAARLDGLPPAERQVILDASVVGKIFWHGALGRLGDGASLPEILDSLERRDLIRREPVSRFQGDVEYSFKHMLIREVAYGTLPKAARRERHAGVARFLEEAAGDRLAEAASLLAFHWLEAGDEAKALDYLVQAADHARRAWAKSEAVSLYTQALELVPDEDGARRRSLLLRRGVTLFESGTFPAAANELDAVLPDLEGHELLEGLLVRAHLGYWLSDPEAAQAAARRATDLAESLDDDHLRSRAGAAMCLAVTLDGDLAEAIALGEQALVSWQPGADAAELAVHLGFLATIQYHVGSFERAVEVSRWGYDLGLEGHAIQGMMLCGGDLGMALTGLGRHEEALQVLERTVAQGRDLELVPTFTSRTMNMQAGTLRELFDLEAARRLNEEGIELARQAGFSYGEVQGKIDILVTDLAEGHVGRAETAWPALWEANQAAKGMHRWLMAGRLKTARAEITLAVGDAVGAAAAASEAIIHAQKHGRLKYELASRAVLGAALLEMGRHPEAVTELRRAVAGAERLAHPPSLWRTLNLLGGAMLALGDDDGAAAAFGRAHETVTGFAATLSEERCGLFLAAPGLRQILSAGR
jgi:class 3 adenylate cyclase/tetratricopeptide (TPR) repeat protein